jgi:hypothetical protein
MPGRKERRQPELFVRGRTAARISGGDRREAVRCGVLPDIRAAPTDHFEGRHGVGDALDLDGALLDAVDLAGNLRVGLVGNQDLPGRGQRFEP